MPQVKDKYPFIYLERGRLEIDDSSRGLKSNGTETYAKPCCSTFSKLVELLLNRELVLRTSFENPGSQCSPSASILSSSFSKTLVCENGSSIKKDDLCRPSFVFHACTSCSDAHCCFKPRRPSDFQPAPHPLVPRSCSTAFQCGCPARSLLTRSLLTGYC